MGEGVKVTVEQVVMCSPHFGCALMQPISADGSMAGWR